MSTEPSPLTVELYAALFNSSSEAVLKDLEALGFTLSGRSLHSGLERLHAAAQHTIDEARKEAFKAGVEAMRETAAKIHDKRVAEIEDAWKHDPKNAPAAVYSATGQHIASAKAIRNLPTPEIPDDHA